MALEISNLSRKIIYVSKGKEKKETRTELQDINPQLSVAEVIKHHSGNRPELLNATIDGPAIEKGFAVYTVTHDPGRLG